MKNVSFKKLQVPVDIEGTQFHELDIRKELGNLIYQNTADLGYLDLAKKIYYSQDSIELSPEEETMLKNFVERSEIVHPIKAGINRLLANI